MEVFEYNGEGFMPVKEFEGWRIGVLRYGERFSKCVELERHLKSDEAFVLLEGGAVIYENDMSVEMEKNKVYNVKKGIWHHITVSEDAVVLVVENSNTTGENSERLVVEKKG